MILAGDVGGTKVHLALFEAKKPRFMLQQCKYQSGDFADFSLLLQEFLAQYPTPSLEKACFGIAGPVQNGRCQATNLPWVVDAQVLQEKMGIPQVWLINDLEANAWGLRCLESNELHVLNAGRCEKGNAALISAGTGLGEAGLFWDGTTHLPFACEGGHADFGARNEEEVELWRYLQRTFVHVSYERILSGPGIYQIYRFLVDTGREKESPEVKEGKEPQRIIGELAVQGKCLTCAHAMELFVSIYGSEAGNLALKMLAVGGVYVGGGIAPKILSLLQKGSFMHSFMAKGRFAPFLAQIPVYIVLNDDTALLGAARYASEKDFRTEPKS